MSANVPSGRLLAPKPPTVTATAGSPGAEETAASATPPEPIIRRDRFLIRPYCMEDAPHLAPLGNNPKIAQFMRNRFPNPYTVDDAKFWINLCQSQNPSVNFAICDAGSAVIGGIGLMPGSDIEYRTWELGYWLGEPYWGGGLATEAAIAFSSWAFETFPDIIRLEGSAFESNPASQRVLAKAGFTFEGRRRKALEKHGVLLDLLTFSLLRDECAARDGSAS